jgi:drug/metabolite transporter (DMT)-like permease
MLERALPAENSGLMKNLKWALLLLLVTAIWGSTFVLVKETLQTFGTFTLMSLRFLLAAALLAAYVAAAKKPFGKKEIRRGAAIGFFLFIGYAAQTYGLNYISATSSAFITGLLVVFVPILTALLLKRAPQRKIWLAVAASVAGMYLLTGANMGAGIGEAATLVCALGFALEVLCIDRLARGCSLPGLLLSVLATVGLLSLAVMISAEGLPSAAPPLPSLAAIAFLALFATILAQAGQIAAQAHLSPAQTALVLLAEPIFAALFGALLLGEALSLPQWAGAMLILSGMLIAEYDGIKI